MLLQSVRHFFDGNSLFSINVATNEHGVLAMDCYRVILYAVAKDHGIGDKIFVFDDMG